MENTEKKTYIAPAIKCHEFKVEAGFATSLTQGINSPNNVDYSERNSVNYNPFHISYTNNNDDWD